MRHQVTTVSSRSKYIGALTLEAAIVIPLFMMFILSVSSVMRIAVTQEIVHYHMCEAASIMSDTGYIYSSSGLAELQQTAYSKAETREEEFQTNVDYIKNNISHSVVDYGMIFQKPSDFTFSLNANDLTGYGREWVNTIEKKRIYLTNYIVGLVHMGSTFMETLSYICEDGSLMFGGYHQSDAIELSNSFTTEMMTKSIMTKYISDDSLKAYGVVDGFQGLDFMDSSYMLSENDIILKVSYEIEPMFFGELIGSIKVKEQVKVRAFVGNGNFQATLKVDKPKKGEEDSLVVYMTRKGMKYHVDPECFHIHVEPKTIICTFNLSQSDICESCGVEEIVTGMILFKTDGDSKYHTSSGCHHIVREPYSLLKTKAILCGYQPCLHCSKED